MRHGAIILCGGKSARMGRDKAMLPFGAGEVMLQRVVRLVGDAVPVSRLVCVAAPGQELPPLPTAVEIVFDPIPHRGPLAGLSAGMATLEQAADVAFVTGCDTPLLKPAFIERTFNLLGDCEIAVPHDAGHWHPLAGVYRTGILPRINALLAAGERSLLTLLETCHTRCVTIEELGDVDPELTSLATCNAPHEYRSAVRESGITTPE
jgi:molybdopterin-guanine dinucleotide biosynthesis protein A